ncbi:hypothetical protein [Flavobacterium pectinovorum]|uniref:Uncharacterized protein n=1 Tax=Flavobacterium pectinovorum TaxID=29533 RepID=A0ABY1J8P8_9FLAO|nr:hypothetical protein [Flavobacterium pectinovorum]SHN13971.1 hypothetical protein SAMN05444387_4255 [Flavobacterium pectinovorum]
MTNYLNEMGKSLDYEIATGGRKVSEETPLGLLFRKAKAFCCNSNKGITVKFTSDEMQI